MAAPYVPQAPAARGSAFAITKSDTTVYDPPLTVLYVGGAGNVAILCAAQGDDTANAVTLTAVPVGSVIRDFAVVRVMSTGTSASLLVGGR